MVTSSGGSWLGAEHGAWLAETSPHLNPHTNCNYATGTVVCVNEAQRGEKYIPLRYTCVPGKGRSSVATELDFDRPVLQEIARKSFDRVWEPQLKCLELFSPRYRTSLKTTMMPWRTKLHLNLRCWMNRQGLGMMAMARTVPLWRRKP